MAIYVDPIFEWTPVAGHTRWAHMGTDDRSEAGIEALHAFAARLGLRRSWYQNKPHHKHYDLTPSKRRLAVQLGAIELTQREYVRTCGSYPERFRRAFLDDEDRPPPAAAPPIQKTLFD